MHEQDVKNENQEAQTIDLMPKTALSGLERKESEISLEPGELLEENKENKQELGEIFLRKENTVKKGTNRASL